MSKLKITYLGHAAFCVEWSDSVFWKDVNFIKRTPPSNLPDPELLLVSHANPAHLDLNSYKYFSMKTPIVLPLGLAPLLKKYFKNPLHEMIAWGELDLAKFRLFSVPTEVPGFHMRSLNWKASSAYVLEKEGLKVFFPGDTAYGDHFKQIANLHEIDLALLPFHDQTFPVLQAFQDLKAKRLIPYSLGSNPELIHAFKDKLSPQALHILQEGECFEF